MNMIKNSKRVKYFLFFTFIFSYITILDASFTRDRGILIDSETGLNWQDNNDSNSTKYTWQEAINFCENLSLNEFEDWRLPNINEFKSIIDRGRTKPAIVNSFEYTGDIDSYTYWSSTTYNNQKDYAWFVHFNYGYINGDTKTNSYYIRCVRGGE